MKLLNLEPGRQQTIINAALKEFALKGFDDASTNAIARESGVSKGLLFHYINTKKELFLYLCDYSLEILKTEVVDVANMLESDILERCRQITLLKMEIMHKHPYVFDFFWVIVFTDSEAVKAELDQRKQNFLAINSLKLYQNLDESRFREGIDAKKANRLIIWAVEGYEKEMYKEIKGMPLTQIPYDQYLADFDTYLDILRKSFYSKST
ncbi:TetR/AcrR family transcriptional regulator [Desulforamulus ruminis]|uniref:Regulatory protein TetR n=1 Tax=Desulforamulus ruminis (strain ATCC 23193 / DSM 2154 / NCIMB 8452 / DL) TaxID=696281 RepID=F6DL28_DESRL|nr:TetR/AcrR family transcriptional regulator [Desulforamulus ruminis]AEG58337.1 regulatory protein TetR [Desulforamulus ruminis DSM 2154]